MGKGAQPWPTGIQQHMEEYTHAGNLQYPVAWDELPQFQHSGVDHAYSHRVSLHLKLLDSLLVEVDPMASVATRTGVPDDLDAFARAALAFMDAVALQDTWSSAFAADL